MARYAGMAGRTGTIRRSEVRHDRRPLRRVEEINALIAELFGTQTMGELVTAGQSRGVPIAAVLSPAETLASEHFRSVGALTEATIAPGVDVTVPAGAFVIDGSHVGIATPAPSADATKPCGTRPDPQHPIAGNTIAKRPFDGLRILDLGIIVAGGELGRLFADLGAEVIKIESAAYPDGLRQTPPGQLMSRSWALTHRNEYSLGLICAARRAHDLSPAWSPAPTRCSPTSSREPLPRSASPTRSCAS